MCRTSGGVLRRKWRGWVAPCCSACQSSELSQNWERQHLEFSLQEERRASRSSSERQRTLKPSLPPCTSQGTRVSVISLLFQNRCAAFSHHTLHFKNHPLLSSRPLTRKGCMQDGQKHFHQKTFLYNLTRKIHHVQEWVKDGILNFQRFSKWVYITSHPFYPEQPEKDHSPTGHSCT